jgi:hypothetical protein
MGRYYILRNQQVVEEPDYAKWAAWRQNTFDQVRRVASTNTKHGTISTDFLGMSMTLSKTDPPLVFETKVEGGWLDGKSERYATLADAKAGHEAWVGRVHAAEEENPLPPPGCPVW